MSKLIGMGAEIAPSNDKALKAELEKVTAINKELAKENKALKAELEARGVPKEPKVDKKKE